MQNEIVPNARFPFGRPLKMVRQRDRTPKKVFSCLEYMPARFMRNGILRRINFYE